MMLRLVLVVLFFMQFIAINNGMFQDEHGQDIVSETDLDHFRKAVILNEDEVALSVGFVNHTRNPYPPKNMAYNVDIDYTSNCYLVFRDSDKATYELYTAQHPPQSEYGVYLTHMGPCGVCSTLQDLAVYLGKRDLTTPVRRCAMIPVPNAKRQCIRNIGFSEKCTWIWFWNAQKTAKSKSNGGCRSTCIRHLNTPNNQPFGTYNPCRPAKKNELGVYEDELNPTGMSFESFPASTGNMRRGLFPTLRGKIAGMSSERKRKEDKGLCKNTINQEPACHEEQYKPGEYRLNACLQCDECKSGPIFQKVSGRTRRASGIRSAIERPGVPKLYHHYYTQATKEEL